MTAMIIKIMVMAAVIQKGASTQIQGQSITLQSFNITKAIPNKPPIPTPPQTKVLVLKPYLLTQGYTCHL